jgi:replicative DNA helicase
MVSENVRLKFIGHLGKFDNLDDYGSSFDDLPSSMNQDESLLLKIYLLPMMHLVVI